MPAPTQMGKPVPSLPDCILRWLGKSTTRLALAVDGGGYELRIIDQGSGMYQIAYCDGVEAATRAIASPGAKQWRVVVPRERQPTRDDAGLDIARFALP